MRIKQLHPNFIMPAKSTERAGAFDIYMPTAGYTSGLPTKVMLGFATEIPENHVALILPRSGVGSKYGIELNNTCGVIDSDYRGEWAAFIKTKDDRYYQWEAGDRLLQFLIVPVAEVTLELVEELSVTNRDSKGFGTTGK